MRIKMNIFLFIKRIFRKIKRVEKRVSSIQSEILKSKLLLLNDSKLVNDALHDRAVHILLHNECLCVCLSAMHKTRLKDLELIALHENKLFNHCYCLPFCHCNKVQKFKIAHLRRVYSSMNSVSHSHTLFLCECVDVIMFSILNGFFKCFLISCT